MRRLAVFLVAVALGLAFAVPSASAHALLQSSQPANGAVLETAPAQVVLSFTERPDPQLSIVHVLDASAKPIERGVPHPADSAPQSLAVALPPGMAKGVYTVTWRTTSEVDGHTTAGSFSFGVGVVPTATSAPAAATQTPNPTPAGVAGRWLVYVGLALIVGAAGVATVLRPAMSALTQRAVLAAWVAATAGVAASMFDEAAVARVGLTTLLRSGAGEPFRYEAVALTFTLALIAAWWKQPRVQPAAGFGVAAALVMLVRATAGHAAAASAPAFALATQWLHFLAVGVWVGGLPFFLLALRAAAPDDKGALAARFSRLATIGVTAVVITGGLRSLDEVGAWNRLTNTAFGQTLLVKLFVVTDLVALAAINRFRHVRAAVRSGAVVALRRTVVAEVGVAALILGVTAVLTGLPPASSVAAVKRAATSNPAVINGSDFATTTRVRLVIRPGTVGANSFDAVVVDYDTREPINATAVRLRFKSLEHATVPESTLALDRGRRGHWRGQGTAIAIDGAWNITVAIDKAGGGVEVPLVFEPRLPAQKVSAQRTPGLPTIYTVTTAGGQQVQVYLDPGKPGLNQLHATYLAPGGDELTVASFAATARRGDTPTASSLVTRKLDDTGHYVADLQAAKGTYHVRVVATLADGATVTAALDLRVA